MRAPSVCFVGKRGSLPLGTAETNSGPAGCRARSRACDTMLPITANIMTAVRAWSTTAIVEPEYDGRENRGNNHLQERRDAG